MFCPNCGNNCGDANFCPKCGLILNTSRREYPPLEKPYVQEISGKKVDLNKVIRTYGTGIRKVGAYAYLAQECGISKDRVKEILDPLYAAHAGEKVSIVSGAVAQVGLSSDRQKIEADRRKELDASGQVYCPKCLSTSISADKKGFGIGKAVIGAAAFGGIGLTAGNIGSKKVICTCLKCGHQWKAGKK